MTDRVWLIILEAGEYSDYFSRVHSAWGAKDSAISEREKIIAKIEAYTANMDTWRKQRDALWDELDPGPSRFWDFSSEEKRREWIEKEPESPSGDWWDHVSVVEVPLNTPGEYWPPEHQGNTGRP